MTSTVPLFFLRKTAICLVRFANGRPFWPPEAFKIASESDAKGSLFRDAMDLVCNTSGGNGTHEFETTKMATRMIRSTRTIDPTID